jgi:hypothetical protein
LEYAAQDAAPDDHAHRALLALEQRVLVTTPEPEGQAAEART